MTRIVRFSSISRHRRTLTLLFLFLTAARPCPAADVQTFIIFAVDGLGANVLRAKMPANFREFQRESAYSFTARGVMPTVTFPNFTSMISGAGPEQHGVTSNEWRPDKFTIAPSCRGESGHFPTIFGLLHQARPTAKLGMFFDGTSGFPFIAEEGVPDKVGVGLGADATLAMALEYITSAKPALVFLHVDLMDHAGHTEGWESPAYDEALGHCDKLLGQIMARLRETGMLPATMVLITADHGGVGKRHGGNSMTELEIPWMLRGPGVAAGKELTGPINTFDTASTIAEIFGLHQPACWIGRPVKEAFGK
jgi:predicted AlkP superfamily pyrophosphatase or phosphodiesterase